MKQNINKEILQTLLKSDFGLTTQEIIDQTGHPYQTITKYLSNLRKEGSIVTTPKGSAKIHFLAKEKSNANRKK